MLAAPHQREARRTGQRLGWNFKIREPHFMPAGLDYLLEFPQNENIGYKKQDMAE
jgi:hypothetical protein